MSNIPPFLSESDKLWQVGKVKLFSGLKYKKIAKMNLWKKEFY